MTGPQQDPTAGGPVQPMPPAGAQPPVQPRPGYAAAPGAPGAATPPPGYAAGAQPPRPPYGPPQPGSAYQPGARPQPNFPGNFGPQGYPPPSYGPSPYSYPPPRQRRTGLLVGIVIAAVVLIGGGVTLLIVLLNSGGGGSAQDAGETYVNALSARDTTTLNDMSCAADQAFYANADQVQQSLAQYEGSTLSLTSVTQNGASGTINFSADFGSGQTYPVKIPIYQNDNGTWLACESGPLAAADQDR